MCREDADACPLEPLCKVTCVDDDGKLGLAVGSHSIVFPLLEVKVIEVNSCFAVLLPYLSLTGFYVMNVF